MREHKKATIVAVVLSVSVGLNYVHDILARAKTYTHLYKSHQWYVVESIDKCVLFLICCGAVWFLHRGGVRGIFNELSLSRISWRGTGVMVLCTTPMLVGFALTRGLDPQLSLAALVFKGLLSPISEEVYARGFTFLQLYRRAGWPFWIAVLPQALLSAFGHIEQGETVRDQVGIFVLIFSGALIFAWCLHEWDSVWVPFALHACMNLWWDLFSVSRNILGGWFPFALQQLTMVLVLCVTYRKRRIRVKEQQQVLQRSLAEAKRT